LRTKTFYKFSLAVFCILYAFPNLAAAKNASPPTYKWVDTGIVTKKGGRGFEIRFETDKWPEGGITGKTLGRDIALLCKTITPLALSHIKAVTGKTKPDFLSVMVKSGISVAGFKVGGFVRISFSTDGKKCLSVIKK